MKERAQPDRTIQRSTFPPATSQVANERPYRSFPETPQDQGLPPARRTCAGKDAGCRGGARPRHRVHPVARTSRPISRGFAPWRFAGCPPKSRLGSLRIELAAWLAVRGHSAAMGTPVYRKAYRGLPLRETSHVGGGDGAKAPSQARSRATTSATLRISIQRRSANGMVRPCSSPASARSWLGHQSQ